QAVDRGAYSGIVVLEQADIEAADRHRQIVNRPEPGAVALVSGQVAGRIVPSLLTVLGILSGASDQRTAAGILAREIPGEPRPGVGGAQLEPQEGAVVDLRVNPRVLAVVEPVVAADDREVVQGAVLVAGLSCGEVAVRGVELVPVAIHEVG